MSFEFDDVEEFGATRVVESNPFIDVVRSLELNSGKGKAFTITDVTATKDEKGQYTSKEIRKVRRQLTEAGDVLGVTVRAKFEDTTSGVRVTFTAVNKIVRTKKDESETSVKKGGKK